MPRPSILSSVDKDYIKSNCDKLPDSKIAKNIGTSLAVVRHYRSDVLNFYKNSATRNKSKPSKIDEIMIQEEIKAIQNFANYPSFMNGAKKRVEILTKMLNGTYNINVL